MTNRIVNHLTRWVPVANYGQRLWVIIAILSFILLVPSTGGLAAMEMDVHQGEHSHMIASGQWAGSAEGIAYSEYNHALAGLGVILVGLTELRTAMGWTALSWSRWLLPGSFVGIGIFLLIWSDHEAWPIGSWTLAETLSDKDLQMLQHKTFGVLALGVGAVEWLRRTGKLGQWVWSALLPGFALIGGGMLFLHMHGPHPAAHQIQIHHSVMGTLALAGGIVWFVGEWLHRPVRTASTLATQESRSILKVFWAIAVLIIGVQLFFYSES